MCWMRWMRLQENKDITQVSLLAFEKNLTRPSLTRKNRFCVAVKVNNCQCCARLICSITEHVVQH